MTFVSLSSVYQLVCNFRVTKSYRFQRMPLRALHPLIFWMNTSFHRNNGCCFRSGPGN